MAEYRAANGVSKSDLDLLHRSPAHYRQAQLCPPEPTKAMKWGSLFHDYILLPEVFEATYAVLPAEVAELDKRTVRFKELWQDWQDANPGKEPVAEPTMLELRGMRDSLFANPYVANALSGGIAEQSIFWHNGVPCKCRPDYIKDAFLIDIKTTEDARPEAFAKSCWTYRYHVQSAHYSTGFACEFGSKPDGFLFVAVEKTPPYAVAIYRASDAMIRQGQNEAERDLAVYQECTQRDIWPAYPECLCDIDLPVWAMEERP